MRLKDFESVYRLFLFRRKCPKLIVCVWVILKILSLNAFIDQIIYVPGWHSDFYWCSVFSIIFFVKMFSNENWVLFGNSWCLEFCEARLVVVCCTIDKILYCTIRLVHMVSLLLCFVRKLVYCKTWLRRCSVS